MVGSSFRWMAEELTFQVRLEAGRPEGLHLTGENFVFKLDIECREFSRKCQF